jgi:hypothetical protein
LSSTSSGDKHDEFVISPDSESSDEEKESESVILLEQRLLLLEDLLMSLGHVFPVGLACMNCPCLIECSNSRTIHPADAPGAPWQVHKTGRPFMALLNDFAIVSGMMGVEEVDCPTPIARESPMTSSRSGEALAAADCEIYLCSESTNPSKVVVLSPDNPTSSELDPYPLEGLLSPFEIATADVVALERVTHLTIPCDGALGSGESPNCTRYFKIATDPCKMAMAGNAKMDATTADVRWVSVHVKTLSGVIMPNNHNLVMCHPEMVVSVQFFRIWREMKGNLVSQRLSTLLLLMLMLLLLLTEVDVLERIPL